MSDLGRIFIQNGIWYGGYEPHDMPGAWARWRYVLTPADNQGMVRDGWHHGMKTGEKLLCIKSKGQYLNGYLINHHLSDFFIDFDDEYHDQYYDGLKRGYQGKRQCSSKYLLTKTHDWIDGYQGGIKAKRGLKKAGEAGS